MIQLHWFTSEKGVHQFRYFLPLIRTPNPIVICSWIYSYVLKWAPMCTPMAGCVHIGAHFNTNPYMHEETTIEFGVRINGRKYLNWCTPFSDVSQCIVHFWRDRTSQRNRFYQQLAHTFLLTHGLKTSLKQPLLLLQLKPEVNRSTTAHDHIYSRIFCFTVVMLQKDSNTQELPRSIKHVIDQK